MSKYDHRLTEYSIGKLVNSIVEEVMELDNKVTISTNSSSLFKLTRYNDIAMLVQDRDNKVLDKVSKQKYIEKYIKWVLDRSNTVFFYKGNSSIMDKCVTVEWNKSEVSE